MTDRPTRHAVITGGSKGFGRSLVSTFAREGCHVLTTARNADALAGLEKEAAAEGLRVTAITGDLRETATLDRLAATVADFGAPLDLLIHNASVLGPRVSLAEYPEAEFEAVIDTNVTAVFRLTQRLLPMLADGANVQIISSGVGIAGKANWGAYSISKFAVEGLGQILADETRDRGLRVHVIDPGGMRTDMRASAFPAEDPATLRHPDDNVACSLWLAHESGPDTSGQRYRTKDFNSA